MLVPLAKQKAFSLIEVLISMFMIGIAFVSLTYLNSQISEESGITWRQMESVDNAWSAMDKLVNINSDSSYQAYVTSGNSSLLSTTTSDEFQIQQRVVFIKTNPNYVVVEGSSTWTDSNGNSHTDKFRTAIPELNPEKTPWYWGG